MSNFEFHLFLALGKDTLYKIISDIDNALSNKSEIIKTFPNYDFRRLHILRKRLVNYDKKYNSELGDEKSEKVINEINKVIDNSLDSSQSVKNNQKSNFNSNT